MHGPLSRLAGKRVLVTGSSGFIGSSFAQRLNREGVSVAGLSRTPGRLAEQPAIAYLACDLEDAQQAVRCFREVRPHIVFHFAACSDGSETRDHATACIRGNALATLNALEACRLSGGELFVYGDSCKVYGDSDVPYREAMPSNPISSYAVAKAAGWDLCRIYDRVHGVPTVSVRPTLIYGPGQSHNLISFVVNSVREGRSEIVLDGGSQTRDPLYIGDALDAFIALAAAGPTLSGRIVNIGGGHEITVHDLARQILTCLGSSLRIVDASDRLRPTEMRRSYCDNQEAGQLLGWRPRTTLETGLRRTIRNLPGQRLRAARVNSRTAEA